MISVTLTVNTKVLEALPASLRASHRFVLEAVKKQVEAAYKDELSFSRNLQNDFGTEIKDSSLKAFFRPRPSVGATTGTSFSAKGRTKLVPLRGQKETNVAQIVDEGRGGVRPLRAKVLLIDTGGKIPVGKPYVIARGKVFVYAQAAGGAKGRKFSEAANRKIEAALPVTIDAALARL